MAVRVAVVGASGRMGTEACRAVEAAEGLELVARVGSGDPRSAVTDAGATVALDLTRPDAVMGTVEHCVHSGVHVVVGTSGMGADRLARVRAWQDERGAAAPSVLVVPNFSVGAVVLMRLAAQAAAHFESVEIVEYHHPEKADAPGGTARRTAEVVAAARAAAGRGPAPDATREALDGARGARVEGVPVHALRVRGMVASQEVVLGGTGEVLALRHDSFDRSSFMPGVLLALRRVGDRPGVTVGLEHLLGLD